MGSSTSKSSENNVIEQIKNIDEKELDMSKIDKLQLQAIKEAVNRIEKLEKEKQTKMIYAMPKVDLCNMSLFWLIILKRINIINLAVLLIVGVFDVYCFFRVLLYDHTNMQYHNHIYIFLLSF